MHRHSWRLKIGTFPVRRLTFASRTAYDDGTLFIDSAELQARVAEPAAVADIAVHLAHPGESCRIVHVLDAVSPMVKVAGPSTVYPGFLGDALPAGSGRTHRLDAAAVLVSGTFPEPTSGALSAAEATVDMSGPAAACCAFSDHRQPGPGVSPGRRGQQRRFRRRSANAPSSRRPCISPRRPQDWNRRGRMCTNCSPLTTPCRASFSSINSTSRACWRRRSCRPPHAGPGADPAASERNARRRPGQRQLPATGALHHLRAQPQRTRYASFTRRHGHDLNFLGVVIGRGWQDTQALKERQGWMMARLASLLGAQVAIVSADVGGTGGNNTIDFMQTIKACEQMGLRTVGIMQESGQRDGSNPTLVDQVPEADALVSVGGVGWDIPLARPCRASSAAPPCSRTGRRKPLDAAGPLQAACWYGAVWKTHPARPVRGWTPDPRRKDSPHDDWHPSPFAPGPLPQSLFRRHRRRGRGGPRRGDARSPLGPGKLLQQLCAGQADVVGTVVCGDGYFGEHEEAVVERVQHYVRRQAADAFIAGPAFGSGRYGAGLRAAVLEVERLGIPAVTGLHAENPGGEVFLPQHIFAVDTAASAAGMQPALQRMTALALKRARGQPLGSAAQEGFLPRDVRRTVDTGVPAATRAVNLALRKWKGEPYVSEITVETFEPVLPPPPVASREHPVCLGHRVRPGAQGQPRPAACRRGQPLAAYSIGGMPRLTPGDWEIVHGGYDNTAALLDPNRVVPLDAMRALQRGGAHRRVAGRPAGDRRQSRQPQRHEENWRRHGRHSQATRRRRRRAARHVRHRHT